jgi:hypothetical protein
MGITDFLDDLIDEEKDPIHGAAVWCIKKRQCWPQAPVEKSIREAGIWDLDSLLPVRKP